MLLWIAHIGPLYMNQYFIFKVETTDMNISTRSPYENVLAYQFFHFLEIFTTLWISRISLDLNIIF